MNIRSSLSFAILIFLMISCSRKICADSVAVNRDACKRYLIILNDSKHPNKLVMSKEIEEAITFLEVVSGIMSKAERNDNTTYRSKSHFKADIQLWEQWYRENKCKLTLHYVDSSFNRLGLKR